MGEGIIAVGETQSNRIHVIQLGDGTAMILKTIELTETVKVRGLAVVDKNTIAVLEVKGVRLVHLDGTVSNQGLLGVGNLEDPYGIAMSDDMTSFLVVDSRLNVISILDRNGKLLRRVGHCKFHDLDSITNLGDGTVVLTSDDGEFFLATFMGGSLSVVTFASSLPSFYVNMYVCALHDRLVVSVQNKEIQIFHVDE